MKKEYGGFFCESIESQNMVEDNENILYFDSARSGIRFLLNKRKWTKKRVLLPDYLCESMLIPFGDNNFEVHFYPIKRDFSINIDKMNELVKLVEPDLIYVISFFGFHTLVSAETCLKKYQEQNISILEDVTHSYYGNFSSFIPDYKVGSLRKWCGLEEGGFLWSASVEEGKLFYEHRVHDINRKVLNLKIKCFQAKRDFLNNISDMKDFVNIYEKSELYLDEQVEVFTMSEENRRKLWYMNNKEIKEKRIKNYRLISENLKNVEGLLSTQIDSYDMGVPLYFPMYVEHKKRNELRKKAREYNVFLPIIWPKSHKLDNYFVENSIYEDILCIPCDQRWETKDILYMCDVIKKIMKEPKS